MTALAKAWRRRLPWTRSAAVLALVSNLLPGVQAAPVIEAPPSKPGLMDFSSDEIVRILAHGPWSVPDARDASNAVQTSPRAVAWGRALFNDGRLSVRGELACGGCHQAPRAFQDGQATPALAADVRRNTPSLLGVAQQRWLGWGGANDSLWAASLAPMLAVGEMGHTLASLAQRVRQTPDLAAGWRRVYGTAPPADDEVVAVGVAKALAAWQATFQLPRNAFDDFRDALARQDWAAAAAYPLPAQRGLRIFIGEGRCHFCHVGPSFSNGEFADIGIPFFVPGGVDSGRHQGLQRLLASPFTRLGRHNDALRAGRPDARATATRHVVAEPRHFGEFRVPGLRQLLQTAPYMHNGSLATLTEVVLHYDRMDPERIHADGGGLLRPLKLSESQRQDLEAFLRSLSR